MGLIPRFTSTDVMAALSRGALEIERGIIQILQYSGEKFVKDARNAVKINSGQFPKGDYTDRTVNLRSSIGYAVLKDGVIITQNFDGETPEGTRAGLDALQRIEKSGYQLIGVAGMDYASSLESKGYNVITSQADVALVELPVRLGRFKDRMNAKGVGVEYDDMTNLVKTMTRR